MNAPDLPLKQQPFLAETHEVVNVAHELGDTNLYLQDVALQEAVRRERAAWAAYSSCHSVSPFEGATCTAVTLYSGQLVAQSEKSVVTTFARVSGWWKVV